MSVKTKEILDRAQNLNLLILCTLTGPSTTLKKKDIHLTTLNDRQHFWSTKPQIMSAFVTLLNQAIGTFESLTRKSRS